MYTKQYYVYIITNKANTTLYVGMTGRPLPLTAIAREKQLKGGSRQKKVDLVSKSNPEWKDLYNDIV